MARNRFIQTNSVSVALVAVTEKTVLQLNAAAGVRVAVTGVSISFNGTLNTAEPVLVKVLRVTAAGTGTARNPLKLDNDIATALQLTGTENHTVEGANSDIVAEMLVHPQAGMPIPIPLPEGEIVMAGGGRLAVKCTAPAGVNSIVEIRGEE